MKYYLLKFHAAAFAAILFTASAHAVLLDLTVRGTVTDPFGNAFSGVAVGSDFSVTFRIEDSTPDTVGFLSDYGVYEEAIKGATFDFVGLKGETIGTGHANVSSGSGSQFNLGSGSSLNIIEGSLIGASFRGIGLHFNSGLLSDDTLTGALSSLSLLTNQSLRFLLENDPSGVNGGFTEIQGDISSYSIRAAQVPDTGSTVTLTALGFIILIGFRRRFH